MTTDMVERKLAAILAADVVGYSRLMAADESGTHARLKELRMQFLVPTIAKHRGRIVKLMGDGALVEFASVVDAVHCAVTIQRGMAERVADAPEHQRIEFRIGVNLGDVIIEDDDIYGDGVNIAARLEGLAEPGGICLSDAAYQQVKGKTELLFQDLGEKELKNIPESVRVHGVNLDPGRITPGAYEAPRADRLAPPDKPSIAVLPFENMSGDPEQEFFADGMTEDIITGLSRFRSLFVIARNSTFAYKGKSLDVRKVAGELGVRYVLEGSIRRAGARIRVTAQLIDAVTGNHVWAERFDRDMEDIFAVQDEVTEAIVAAIAPEIGEAERARAQRTPPENLDAWGLYQRGLAAYYSSTEDGLRSAIAQFDRVNEVDPTFAPAFAMAAGARWRYVMHFQPEHGAAILNQALGKARTAITLDPRDPTGLSNAGKVHNMLGQHDMAVSMVKEATALNPTDAMAHYFLGSVLRGAGRSEEAIPHIDRAIRLSPRDIWITGMLTDRAFVLFDLERYDEAFEWAQRARLSPNPRTMTLAVFAAVLSKLGRKDEARAAVDDLLAHAPGLSYTKYRENQFGTPEVMERLAVALREVGLPE